MLLILVSVTDDVSRTKLHRKCYNTWPRSVPWPTNEPEPSRPSRASPVPCSSAFPACSASPSTLLDLMNQPMRAQLEYGSSRPSAPAIPSCPLRKPTKTALPPRTNFLLFILAIWPDSIVIYLFYVHYYTSHVRIVSVLLEDGIGKLKTPLVIK